MQKCCLQWSSCTEKLIGLAAHTSCNLLQLNPSCTQVKADCSRSSVPHLRGESSALSCCAGLAPTAGLPGGLAGCQRSTGAPPDLETWLLSADMARLGCSAQCAAPESGDVAGSEKGQQGSCVDSTLLPNHAPLKSQRLCSSISQHSSAKPYWAHLSIQCRAVPPGLTQDPIIVTASNRGAKRTNQMAESGSAATQMLT